MKKTIYFMRHSEVLKGVDHGFDEDILQEVNEKSILSVNGEKKAEEMAKLDEFKNLDLVVSSNYVRAMSTAKYFTLENNTPLAVVGLFNERRHGVDSWEELPENFEEKQFNDFNFKVKNGESLNEVRERMLSGLELLLHYADAENILVVSHATCITAMLSTWCDIKYGDTCKFKDKIILDKPWEYLECFKLEFVDCELVDINNLNI